MTSTDVDRGMALDPNLDLGGMGAADLDLTRLSPGRLPSRRERLERSRLLAAEELAPLPDPGPSLTPRITFPMWAMACWATVMLGLGMLSVWAMFHPLRPRHSEASPSAPSVVQTQMHVGALPSVRPTPLAHPTPEVLSPQIVDSDPPKAIGHPVAAPRSVTPTPASSSKATASQRDLCVRTTAVLLAHAQGNVVVVNNRQVRTPAQVELACSVPQDEPPSLVFTVGH